MISQLSCSLACEDLSASASLPCNIRITPRWSISQSCPVGPFGIPWILEIWRRTMSPGNVDETHHWWFSRKVAVSQVFQRSGHSPLAPTHQVALSKLERHPPPRGFEEFFAKLAADPLVQVHSRNQNSIQFPVSWETNMSRNQRYKISRILGSSDLHDDFPHFFCWTPGAELWISMAWGTWRKELTQIQAVKGLRP